MEMNQKQKIKCIKLIQAVFTDSLIISKTQIKSEEFKGFKKMSFSNEKLSCIHDKTDGCCHLCGKKHSFSNYGITWEVEHSIPKLLGGTDHLNNLFVGCIHCNRSKQAYSTRSVRNWNGLKKAPLSRRKKQEQRENQIIGGFLILFAGILLIASKNNKPNFY